MSARSFYLILLHIGFIVIGRLVLPVGEEADYSHRVAGLLYSDFSAWSPYYYFQPFLISHNWFSGSHSAEQNFLRIILTLVVSLPLMLLLFFKFKIAKFLRQIYGSDLSDTQILDADAILLSLLFPSMWFHIGLLSTEQLTLVLSLILVAFIRKKIIASVLLVIISQIDFGNSIVVGYFLLLYYSYSYFSERVKVILILSIAIIFFSFVVGLDFLLYIDNFPLIGDKAAAIYYHYTTIYSDVADKYPSFLRPVITFVSGVFMLPHSHLMVLPLYLLAAYYLLIVLRQEIRYMTAKAHTLSERGAVVGFFSTLTMMGSLPMILSGYSNVKYYIFALPFIFSRAIRHFSFSYVFVFVIFSNFIVISFLLIDGLRR